MTGVDKDLATLRQLIPHSSARARVEAELSRLREAAEFAGMPAWERLWREKEAAEARCAHLQDANGRLLSEKARLQQALEHALDCKGWGNGLVSERGGDPAICTKCEAEAREALAGPDTPADSLECDHGITLTNKQTGVERCAECGATVPADSHSWNQPLAKLEDGKWVDPFVPADSQEDTA